MNKDEAFIKAYRKIVAVASNDAVESFLNRYHEDHDVLYGEFVDYTSMMDALGMWEAGIKFERMRHEQQLERH
jgi:hypothetical protein